MDGAFRHIACGTPAEKQSAFQRIYGWLRRIPEKDARQTVAELCRMHDVDVAGLCSDLVMGWDELRELASDPLVTIGAHTRRHYALAGLSIAEAQLEIEESVQRIEAVRAEAGLVHARTKKGELFVLALQDVFAGAVEETQGSSRKAGFV